MEEINQIKKTLLACNTTIEKKILDIIRANDNGTKQLIITELEYSTRMDPDDYDQRERNVYGVGYYTDGRGIDRVMLLFLPMRDDKNLYQYTLRHFNGNYRYYIEFTLNLLDGLVEKYGEAK